MNNDDDYLWIKEDLTKGNLEKKVSLFKVLIKDPTGDKRVVKLIEKFIDDDTPCIVSIPILIGELKYLAARVLVSEFKLLKEVSGQSIQVVEPLSPDELGQLKIKFNLELSLYDLFTKLREMNELPMMEISY